MRRAGTLNIFREHCSVFGLQALIIISSFRAATKLDMGLGGCPVMVAVSDNSFLTCQCHWDQNFQLLGNADTFPAFPQSF